MNYTGKKSFVHNAEHYEVRIWIDQNSIKVRAFKKDGTPADPYEFSIKLEDQIDAKNEQSSIDPCDALVQTAEEYVRNDTWGEYLKAMKKT